MGEITGKHAAVDFQMPCICSPLVRPGRPAEVAWVVSEQLSNALSRLGFLDLYRSVVFVCSSVTYRGIDGMIW
jgi:hypothetical protein